MDSYGRLLSLALSPDQASDHTYARSLAIAAAHALAPEIIGDKGYDSIKLRAFLTRLGIVPVIPSRRSNRCQVPIDKKVYTKRNKVERFIGRIKEYRRVATRYDKTATHFEAFVLLDAILTWINTIC